MPLTTISDLEREPPDQVAMYTMLAQDLKIMYEAFIEHDDESVSFPAGWGGSASRAHGLHASELSTDGCQRWTVYSLMGAEKQQKVDSFWKKRFRIGHMIHAMLQNDFARMAAATGGTVTFEPEVAISPKLQEGVAKKYGVHSHCDGVFSIREVADGPVVLRVGVEVKSESPDEFKEIKEPKPYHKDQALIYMKCLDLPLIWFVYYNKGNQNIVPSIPPYLMTFDHRRWAEIEDTIIARRADAAEQRLPERKEGIKCEFCPYGHICRPDYLAKKAKRAAAKEARKKAKSRNPHKQNRGLRVVA